MPYVAGRVMEYFMGVGRWNMREIVKVGGEIVYFFDKTVYNNLYSK